MDSDRVARDDVFDAIVSRLVDPECRQLRRRVGSLACALFLVGLSVVVLSLGGWGPVVAYSLSFVTSLVVGARLLRRRLGLGAGGRRFTRRLPLT